MINTKKVAGRRSVRYESFDDLLADAQRVAGGEVQTIGNWSIGQIFGHLAIAFNGSIDGMDFKLPFPVRWIMTLLFKRKFMQKSIPAGFKTGKQFLADSTSTEESLELLRQAIERQKSEPKRAAHPGFGTISRQEWDDFHLRHAELHMSFIVDQ